MPTPARAAMFSRATSWPSAAKASVAAKSSLSRLRRASARWTCCRVEAVISCRNGGASVYTVCEAEEAPFEYSAETARKESILNVETQTRHLSVTPRPYPALGADFPSAEPSHIHIPRPSRALRQRTSSPVAAPDVAPAAEPDVPLAPAA